MIKGMTVVERVGAAEDYAGLTRLFAGLGFEPGKGWKDASGEGSAWLAPVGNLELIVGREPAVPRILVETTELEAVHGVVKRWVEEPTSQMRDVGHPVLWAGYIGGAGSKRAMVAPVGSARMVIHPMWGISMGPLWMVAPSDLAFSVDSLMSLTPT